MLWIGHFLVTWLYFGRLTLWSIAPDIPMMLFLTPGYAPWSVKKDWFLYSLFYKMPHSFWALYIIPRRHRWVYAFHILCDIMSHTGKWSIQPLYPLRLTIHGIWDPVEWI
jgi:hypothetical protein